MDLTGNSIIYKIFNTLKDIKDYLHLYWGCAIADSSDGNFIVCESIDADFLKYLLESPRLKDFKLILRPLSDMTVEEKTEEYNIGLDPGIEEQFRWLLSKGFDLFNLHEQGLCLYKSDLQCEKK